MSNERTETGQRLKVKISLFLLLNVVCSSNNSVTTFCLRCILRGQTPNWQIETTVKNNETTLYVRTNLQIAV